ncbi:tyrosine-type recombinase/integrase [Terasakiella pusilla]|uniref:tyrosine-type recombinase/integrase n=1 Tax=Terasakiella pusilla TaxID=64973 RepID=UPI003AA95B27
MRKVDRKKLTKTVLSSLEAREKEYIVWDTELTGLGARVAPTGRRTFILKYRNSSGRSKQLTIGKFGPVTVDEARTFAKQKLGEIASGQDPVLEKRKARDFETVGELCDRYLKEARAGRVLRKGKSKKPETLNIDEGRINRHIKPCLGSIGVDSLERRDVQKFISDVTSGKTACNFKSDKKYGRVVVTGGPGTAAKAVGLLSSIYNWAINNGLAQSNPCTGVEKPADNKRQRYLRKNEYEKLGKALLDAENAHVNPIALAAIRVLLLTGARRNEILGLKWSEVDGDGQCLRFESTKTGKQIRPLGQKARDYLLSLDFGSDIWVFPASRGEGHLVNVRKPLLQVLRLAGLENDITPHVFRHSFATTANELSYTELTIAGMIGHSLGTITSRYAHNVDHSLVAAADRVSREIWNKLFGSEEAEIIQLNDHVRGGRANV